MKPASARLRAHGDLGVAQKVSVDLTRALKETEVGADCQMKNKILPRIPSEKVGRQPVRGGA